MLQLSDIWLDYPRAQDAFYKACFAIGDVITHPNSNNNLIFWMAENAINAFNNENNGFNSKYKAYFEVLIEAMHIASEHIITRGTPPYEEKFNILTHSFLDWSKGANEEINSVQYIGRSEHHDKYSDNYRILLISKIASIQDFFLLNIIPSSVVGCQNKNEIIEV